MGRTDLHCMRSGSVRFIGGNGCMVHPGLGRDIDGARSHDFSTDDFQEFMRSGNFRLGPQLEWKYRSPRVPG